MIERARAAIFGFLSLCGPVLAQQTTGPAQIFNETITLAQLRSTGALDTAPALILYRPDISSAANGSLLIHGVPALMLLDGRRFSDSSPMARMGLTPLDLFPIAFLKAVEVERVDVAPIYGADATGGVVNLRMNRNYTGSEVGLFYGKSTGAFGREEKQTYFISGAGDEKFNVTVGAFYEQSSGRVPRVSVNGSGQ